MIKLESIFFAFLCLFGLSHVSAQTEDPCAELTSGFLPDPVNCRGYLSCQGGVGYPQTCPDGYVYNHEKVLCDYPSNVPECDSSMCVDIGVYFRPSKTSCQEYIICFDGQSNKQDCGDGFEFDEKVGKCMIATDTDCFINACPAEDDPQNPIFLADKDCNQYYVCLKGEPVPQTCATGLHFGEAIKNCAPPEVAVCKYAPPTTSATFEVYSHSEPRTTSVVCPSTGFHLLSNPTDCEYFFICSDGKYVLEQCAPGLAFDAQTSSCRIASEVQCY